MSTQGPAETVEGTVHPEAAVQDPAGPLPGDYGGRGTLSAHRGTE